MNLYNQGNDNTGLTSDELIAQGTGGSGSNRTSLTVLALKGLADGLNAVSALFGFEGGMPPPANPGAVLVNGVTQALAEGMSSVGSGLGYGAGNATFSTGNSNGAQGNVNIEPGAIPDVNEVRAGQGLADAGYDVSHQPTANSQGITDVRTADLSINGVGQVDVYTPVNTSPSSIVRNIEAKFDQANGIIVQANLSETDMNSIASRIWGKPNGQNFNTIFFQDSNGQVFRFDRATGGQ